MLLPYDINVGAVWTLRSTMPFSARAGRDLNNDGRRDGQQTDYVPGTTRNMVNRGKTRSCWRRSMRIARRPGTPAIERPCSDSRESARHERLQQLDVRASKAIFLGANRKLEFIAQVFNLFGTDNLGGLEKRWQENALSDSFGRILSVYPRQQAELAVRVGW